MGVAVNGRVAVNGVEIPEPAILAEMQNHPADSAEQAMQAAVEALVVRELLLQEARSRGLEPEPGSDELPEEGMIRRLVEQAVSTPSADEDSCRRYFEGNRRRFRSPEGFDAQHVLCAAPADEPELRSAAKARALEALRTVLAEPGRFGEVARAASDCPSKANDGRLGLVQRGDADPVFETYLMSLAAGETCPKVVETKYGFHVIRLLQRLDGRDLPYEAVRDRIAQFLEESSWRRGVHQFVAILAGRAAIEGATLESATSPLVQ